jgi:NADH dehydrogenase
MIVIAGGTGWLGTEVVRLLTARGLAVRVLTRDPARARHLEGPSVEAVAGDVRDPRAVERAVTGAATVISAVHGFIGTGSDSPRTVDGEGNSNVIRAAQAAGVEHVILISIHGAAPDHPMELMRMKFQAEEELRASGLAWTIIRATAYMETWANLVGEPLVTMGKARIFGRGTNPINFVSVADVARFVEFAATDPALRGEALEVGGPDNLTFHEVVQTFATVTGKTVRTSHVPLPMMRLMAVVMRSINPTLARQIQAGVVMDTHDMSFDPAALIQRFPSIVLTPLPEVVRRHYFASF